MPEKLLTSGEVAALLGISEQEVRNLSKKGELPAYKVGGRFLRFRKEQIETIRDEIPTRIASLDRKPFSEIKKSATKEYREFSQEGTYPETLGDRILDFFYFNDFYIISGAVILLIIWVIFCS